MNRKSEDKESIISEIEDDCLDGEAFDDDVVKVLKKLTLVDLCTLNKAFYRVYRYALDKGKELGE